MLSRPARGWAHAAMRVPSARSFSSPMSHEDMVASCARHTVWPWIAQKSMKPLSMVKAEGVHFWDANGKKYMDWNSQLMCSNIGHGHPAVIKAIQDQAAELTYAGPLFATKARAEFGPALAKHTPGELNSFFMCLGGAEAVENAIKVARAFTGRTKILSRYRSYHGATHGAVSLTGDNRRLRAEPGIPGVVHFHDPFSYRSSLHVEGDTSETFAARCLSQLEETIIFEGSQSVAAIIVEPVTGSNGIIVPPATYLPGLRTLCDKYGILMIADEVMAGFGRTGEWFAVDNWNVTPDLMTMAKGITSAYLPLGVLAMSDTIAESFNDTPFPGGLTYCGHPMGAACAVATLKVMEDEDLVGNSKRLGLLHGELLAALKAKHCSVGDVRSIGLFGATELVKCRKTKEIFGPADPAFVQMLGYLREHGLFAFNFSNCVFSNPPLCINEEQLREGFEIMHRALHITDRACH